MSVFPGSASDRSGTVEQGQELWHLGALVRFQVTGKETDGRFWVAEHWAPRGYGPTLHSHDREDELFVVLHGELAMSVAGTEFVLEPGATGFGPRGIAHTFKVSSPTAHFLVLGAPAGFERWFVRTGEPAVGSILPPSSAVAEIEHVVGSPEYIQTLRDYGVEVLGPLDRPHLSNGREPDFAPTVCGAATGHGT